jgi:hypothetical protein
MVSTADTVSEPTPSVLNLRAFAKLYGYVRFFHPSDEASAIDWDRFAAYGAGRVLGCADAKALRQTLDELFRPIAPTVQVYRADERAREVKLSGDKTTCEPVAWNHQGVWLSNRQVTYASRRVGRPTARDLELRSVTQELELPAADSPAERTLRVRVRARTTCTNQKDPPKLLAVCYAAGGQRAAFEQATTVPIAGDSWQEFEAQATIGKDYGKTTIGVARGVDGDLWADDFEAWVGAGDSWTKLTIRDADFEDAASMEQSEHWYCGGGPVKSADSAFSGRNCLLVPADPACFLDCIHVSPGEHFDKPLGPDLCCRVPLCLWSSDGHTLPRADSSALACLCAALDKVNFDSKADPAIEVRLGDVIIVWNVMQHFYPYFDVVTTDWDEVLTSALTEALTNAGRSDFLVTLKRMAVELYDGHARASDSAAPKPGFLPARLEMVEGRPVVTSAAAGSGLQRGDVLLAINDRPSAFDDELRLASGSPRCRRTRTCLRVMMGPKTDAIRFLVERGDHTLTVTAAPSESNIAGCPVYPGESIREIEPGIWYVDLSRASMPEIDAVMDVLARAIGVVFDMRGYPHHNHAVISHLLTGKDRTDDWMRIPQIVYPDHERTLGWFTASWHLEPKEPRITGKTVFLTDSRAISYAESFMGYIEGYKLAGIVGQPTAGTNGNMNPFDLPGGYVFYWTGMKVVKHDGSQLHLIGIQPTVPVERTLKAVREGRDEYIEAALKIIRQ